MGAASNDLHRAEHEPLQAFVPLLELVASPEPIEVLLRALVLFVERLSGKTRCSILLADTQTTTLRHGAAPNLPPDYCAAIDNLVYAENEGSCGTAAARREMVVVADIQNSPLWLKYRDLARRHGLAACWSVPLLDIHGDLLGTFAMYYSEPREPTSAELDVLRIAGPLGALVIQRHRDAQRLRSSEARYRQLTETLPDAILAHRGGRINYANAAAARLVGLACGADLVDRPLDEFCAEHAASELNGHRAGMLACRLLRKDGTSVFTEVTATEVTVDGQQTVLLICRDVSDRKTLEDALVDAANREQENLGYDLHDGIGQQLTGISMLLGALKSELKSANPRTVAELEVISSLVSQTIEDTRRLASGMAPVSVERAGLEGALRTLASDAKALYNLIVTVRVGPGLDRSLPTARATQLYRIAQEAVRNAARHAQARRVRVVVDCAAEEMTMTITDDGVGLQHRRADGGGLGLRSMQYRAARLGGQVWFEARRPAGTRIRVCCPITAHSRP